MAAEPQNKKPQLEIPSYGNAKRTPGKFPAGLFPPYNKPTVRSKSPGGFPNAKVPLKPSTQPAKTPPKKTRKQKGGFYPSVYGGVAGATMLAPLVARQCLRMYNNTRTKRKSKHVNKKKNKSLRKKKSPKDTRANA